MRVPTLHTTQRAFEGIDQRLARQAQIQQQLGSGLRVSRPGDDPLAAAQAEMARSRLAHLSQDDRAAQLATSLLGTAEGALGQGLNLLQGARELLVAAGDGAYSVTDRQALAAQLRAIRDQLVDVANTSDGAGGRVFGGMGASGAPAGTAATDWQAAGGVQRIGEQGRYAASIDGRAAFMAAAQGNGVFVTASAPGNTGDGWIDAGSVVDPAQLTTGRWQIDIGGAPGSLTYAIRDPVAGTMLAPAQPLPAGGGVLFAGQRVAIGGSPAPGDAFDVQPAGRQSVFAALDDAIAMLDGGLRGGVLAERLHRALAGTDRAIDGLSFMRTQVGGELRLLQEASAGNESQTLAAQTRRSQLQDVDFADAVSQLQSNQTGLEAALKAYSMIGSTSLMQLLR